MRRTPFLDYCRHESEVVELSRIELDLRISSGELIPLLVSRQELAKFLASIE
jgi:hypothetical protein